MIGRHFSTSFCTTVVVSKQGTNMIAFLAFFDQEKAQLPAIRVTEQPMLLTKIKINRQGYQFCKYFR